MRPPSVVKTENEARRCSCPYYLPLIGQHGEMRFVTCRASECMAWRWTLHQKVENREPRPTGFCGRIGHTPPEQAELTPRILEPTGGDMPSGSIVRQ